LLAPVLGRGNFRVSVDADNDFSQLKESLVKYGDSHLLSQDETIHSRSPNGEQAIGIPGALSKPTARDTDGASGHTEPPTVGRNAGRAADATDRGG
jgi:flagellar M-ring protein FliF